MNDSVAGDPADLGRIADALEGAGEQVKLRAEHIATMGEAVAELVTSTNALIIAIEGNHRSQRQFRWLMALGTALVLVGVVAAIVLGIRLNGVASSNHETNQLIASCVVPTGACHRAQQATTAAAINDLEKLDRRDAVAAAWCASQPHVTTFAEVESCVDHRVGP